MRHRQSSFVRGWFVVDQRISRLPVGLPCGIGILVLGGFESEALRREARRRGVTLIEEAAGQAARVHDSRELRRALLARTPMILLSPLYPTASHPGWRAIPKMRAAALARLGGRRLIALGGMDAQRFRRIARLGFQGWAGISALKR